MTAAPHEPDVRALFAELVQTGRMIDLSHPMEAGMPVFPQHGPFTMALHRRHGDPHARPRAGGSSFANEMIVMPGHVATHIDALGHFSRCGCVYGGRRAADIESRDGLTALHAGEIGPIWRRAVLLDAASHLGVDVLPWNRALDAVDLQAIADAQRVSVQAGDVVLVRTGWARHWKDVPTFNGADGGFPGPCSDGTQWLLDRGVHMVGSDTPAFEAIPSPGDSVHAMLLVDRGIHIIENLNLEALAEARIHRFLFVGMPLRIVGATGAPFRPMALS